MYCVTIWSNQPATGGESKPANHCSQEQVLTSWCGELSHPPTLTTLLTQLPLLAGDSTVTYVASGCDSHGHVRAVEEVSPARRTPTSLGNLGPHFRLTVQQAPQQGNKNLRHKDSPGLTQGRKCLSVSGNTRIPVGRKWVGGGWWAQMVGSWLRHHQPPTLNYSSFNFTCLDTQYTLSKTLCGCECVPCIS